MGKTLVAVALLGALLVTPRATIAAAPASSKAKDSKVRHSAHATVGTVKSVDATSLVLTRPGKGRGDMTFELAPSVKTEGTVATGAQISVRYHNEGKKHVATAITVRRPA